MTGDLTLKRTDDTYWNYIRSQKPEAWNTSQDTHGLIIDIGNTNSYKQQFKIQGRSGKDLFEMHDDGKAQATLLGNLDVANVLKQGGYPIATQVYVQQAAELTGIDYTGGCRMTGQIDMGTLEVRDPSISRGRYQDMWTASLRILATRCTPE